MDEEDGKTSGQPNDPNAAAFAAVLGAATHDAGVAAQTRAFLEEQTQLAREQIHLVRLQSQDLQREDRVRHWSLRVRHISDVLKLGLELAAATIVTAVAVVIGGAFWSAAHDHALVIEAFNVPVDMTAQGRTGQVVATQLQDRLAWMQAHTDTARQASTFRNNWSDDIKVQIPDTGISIGEFYRYLANWLGDETSITGEVYRSQGNLTISARVGGDAAEKFSDNGNALDRLIDKVAEHIYRQTQPYRYAVFLGGQNREAEATDVVRELAQDGAAEDRPWAFARWGLALLLSGDLRGDLHKQRLASTLNPGLPNPIANLAAVEGYLGYSEAELRDLRSWQECMQRPVASELAPHAVAISIPFSKLMVADATGDYSTEATVLPEIESLRDYSNAHSSGTFMAIAALAKDHDIAASRRADPDANSERNALRLLKTNDALFDAPPLPVMERARMMDDWKAVSADLTVLHRWPEASDPFIKSLLPQMTWPWLAYADARLGDFPSAHALIDRTPADCYLCLRMRANIDAAQMNPGGAAWWFGRAITAGPSIPFAYADWGSMLLQQGSYDAAIAKFRAANLKGPHFADPLEMWGEALMRQNRSNLALAKFEEAGKYAPNWGRLHLEWGKALFYAGKQDEANKQFALAQSLDLSSSDKSALEKWMSIHG